MDGQKRLNLPYNSTEPHTAHTQTHIKYHLQLYDKFGFQFGNTQGISWRISQN